MSQYEPSTETRLSPDDAAAIDALLDSGLDATAASAIEPARADRIAKAAAVLALINTDVGTDRALADVAFARVLQARRQESGLPVGEGPRLGPDDEEALEAWVMHGFDAQRVAASLRERAQRHEAIATAVAAGPEVDVGDGLVGRTLVRVQAWIDRESEAMSFGRPRRRGPGIRLADIISVAAVILIGCSVVFPIMGALREQGRRAQCMVNLGNTATALSTYANSNRDSLPVATAGLSGGTWWNVGQDPARSNSANLYTLARDKYTALANLACPGNSCAPTAPAGPDARDWRRIEEVSYSYQIVFGPVRTAWKAGPKSVVLADRSPVVLRAVRGEMIDPFANAPNHGGAGQHLLFNDNTVQWAGGPVLANGDNIWLPRALEVRAQQATGRGGPTRLNPLSGTELPDAPDDAVLGP